MCQIDHPLVIIWQKSHRLLINIISSEKTWRYSARKVMEFGQLMADILVYVSCKFEMYILEIAQVIGENVSIEFLYVLSIYNGKLSVFSF